MKSCQRPALNSFRPRNFTPLPRGGSSFTFPGLLLCKERALDEAGTYIVFEDHTGSLPETRHANLHRPLSQEEDGLNPPGRSTLGPHSVGHGVMSMGTREARAECALLEAN